MATITQLDLTPGRQETDWTVNVYGIDASAGIDIRPATPEVKYGINTITITYATDKKWFQILNGATPLIGPVVNSANVPYTYRFASPVYCDVGNAMILKTETAGKVNVVIEGKVAPAISSVSASISASASPS